MKSFVLSGHVCDIRLSDWLPGAVASYTIFSVSSIRCVVDEVEGRAEIFLENNASAINNPSRSGGAFQLRTRQ